jgi:hypothetical protein
MVTTTLTWKTFKRCRMNDELIIALIVDGVHQQREYGIPLRPLFAGLAMCGLLANPSIDFAPEDLADVACNRADALLKRLDEKPEAEPE